MHLPALTPTPNSAEIDLVGSHIAKARALARTGKFVAVAALLPAAAWLVFAPLSSAVVASGFVKVDLNRSIVQHAEGGTVRAVYVRDGQHVRVGEALIELGDVSVSADKTRLAQRLMGERAGLARLEAEQSRHARLEFPADLVEAARTDSNLRAQMDKEMALFSARINALEGQSALLRKQKVKIAQEVDSLNSQIANARQSAEAQGRELALNSALARDGLVSSTQVMQLEASTADYRAKLNERTGDLARADQRNGDIDLRISQLENDYRQQASDQLKLTNVRVQELEQELRKATDASRRQVLTASVDGEVIGLRITSPGGVLAPREAVAEIVPTHPHLVVEARIRTEDINRVQRDQLADIRFTAFKYRTTQLVSGRVTYIGADRQVDRDIGMAYYIVTVDVPPDAVAAAVKGEDGAKLQAGMPAEIYLHGGERTPLQYLLEPVTQVLRRAARER